MTRYSWRYLLVCLMLVTVPFQGIAATLMLACDVSHGAVRAQAAVVESHDHGAHVQHLMHQASPEKDVFLATDRDTVAHSHFATDDHRSPHSDVHKNHPKYSDCCSSGISAATGELMLIVAVLPANRTDFFYISSSHRPPALGGLDRPPQRTSA